MIRGLIILESGEVQMIGQITTARNIIQSMVELIESFQQQEKQQTIAVFTSEELQTELQRRSSEQSKPSKKTGILEP